MFVSLIFISERRDIYYLEKNSIFWTNCRISPKDILENLVSGLINFAILYCAQNCAHLSESELSVPNEAKRYLRIARQLPVYKTTELR